MSINKIKIVKELINHYSKNFTSEDFTNDLTNERENSQDKIIETYTKEIYAELDDLYAGPLDLMIIYWWHKGRTSSEKSSKTIPEEQKEIVIRLVIDRSSDTINHKSKLPLSIPVKRKEF